MPSSLFTQHLFISILFSHKKAVGLALLTAIFLTGEEDLHFKFLMKSPTTAPTSFILVTLPFMAY